MKIEFPNGLDKRIKLNFLSLIMKLLTILVFIFMQIFLVSSYGKAQYWNEDNETKRMKFEKHKKECNEGDKKSCVLAGSNYIFGSGVEKDNKKGEKILLNACDAGEGLGCMGLGNRYLLGDQGFNRDIKYALSLYEKGCALKYGPSCVLAGTIYANSKKSLDIVKIKPEEVLEYKDLSKSMEYYKKACEYGGVRGICDEKRNVKKEMFE